MPSRSRYTPNNYRFFNRLLRITFGAWLKRAYNLEVVGLEVFRRVRPPYVVVPTHAAMLDPFLVGSFVPAPVYWVTGDGNMRTRLLRSLLKLVGSIPKSKAIPDMETVGMMVDVIRKKRGVVGVFAEGQATWDGRTQGVFPSTAKLLKLLKAPVVVAVLKGMYLSHPRWSWLRRKGKVVLEFKLAFEPEELKTLDADAIHERLVAAMDHDEFRWLEGRKESWRGRARAEHLELALFTCPECGAVGSLRSFRNRFRCHACGALARVDRRGGFVPVGEAKPFRFRDIGEWDAWQGGAFRAWLAERSARHPDRPLFADPGVALLKGHRMNPLRRLRTGLLVLYPDRIELAPVLGARLSFPLGALSGIGTLKQHLFEFYDGKALYQVRFARRWCSGRKWQAALEFLADLRGEAPEPAGRAFTMKD
ncbi:MAG: 1-acyl-sn-glycerol-3-phosphate acyltransferase [Spirochaetales bacterium]|nr:1-acyl-sn-glycerol-3-phosphate acyltransferase [Spirochaetales bacterium]